MTVLQLRIIRIKMHTKLLNDLLTDRKTVLQKRNTVRWYLKLNAG